MGFDVTSFLRGLIGRKEKLAAIKVLALKEVAEEMKNRIQKRIFGDGKNEKEVPIGLESRPHPDGTPATKYSKSYKRVREKFGKQTAKIDYNFTGRLKSQLAVVWTISGSIKIEIQGDRAKIAQYLDERRPKTFAPTMTEKALAKSLLGRKLLVYKKQAEI